MASIRARHGVLVVDFRYHNIRCREKTNLTDTPANRKKLEKIIEKMEAEIKKLYLEIEELEREQGAATGQPVIIVDSWGNIADEVSEALAAETNDPEEGPDNA